jgi:histidinol dehydrogenase
MDRAIDAGVERAVARILKAVRKRGDAALRDLTRRFDGARRAAIEVGARERRVGAREVGGETRAALRFAQRRIARFARRQRASLRPFRLAEDGIVLEQRLIPVTTVGIYVPGGRYPLCSTVLMAAVPARIAGCRDVLLCTPPRRDGSIAPEIVAAAEVAGVDRIFAVGGAQAIAAMALGTRSIPRVDLIVGPGNAYVAAAKVALAGEVGIDFVAGPTELLVIADGSSDPLRVASDLVGQAEHDPRAGLWLVALGRQTVSRVRTHLKRITASLPDLNRRIARPALDRIRVVRCGSIREAAAVANRVAPEHLSVQLVSPRRLLPWLTSYGSLFLGGGSAIALGDYVSGPNHILPTDGAARHTGGLSVLRYLKAVTVQEISDRGARGLARAATKLASIEGLEAHRLSVSVRVSGSRPAGGILFDFDGVLVETEVHHWRAFREVLAPLGIALPRALYDRRYLAFDDRSALRAMLQDGSGGKARPTRRRLDDLVRRKQAAFAQLCGAALRVEPPAADLVRALARRLPLAIVSGAARREILTAVTRGGIRDAFGTIVAAEDVGRCKPDPEGYRLALKRLGLGNGAGSIAIEDSPGGIRAARAAGLRVLGIASSYSGATLRRAGAYAVVRSIRDLSERTLLGR